MRPFLICLACAAFAAAPLAKAQDVADVPVGEAGTAASVPSAGSERRLAGAPARTRPAGAAYGPFRVLDEGRAALVDATDSRTPQQFAAMLQDHPGIRILEMIDCPGTEDDLANLQVGRMIRQRSISTYVPTGGSVRSGGVELFLAGVRRYADPGAEFAVHSWQDESGLEAADYAATSPENRRYTDYYRQMGMSGAEAIAFYAMTNAVPFSSARWFGAGEMAAWVPLDDVQIEVAPRFQFARYAPVLDSVPSLQ